MALIRIEAAPSCVQVWVSSASYGCVRWMRSLMTSNSSCSMTSDRQRIICLPCDQISCRLETTCILEYRIVELVIETARHCDSWMMKAEIWKIEKDKGRGGVSRALSMEMLSSWMQQHIDFPSTKAIHLFLLRRFTCSTCLFNLSLIHI